MAFNPLRGIAQSITGRVLKKVAGNLPGLLGLNTGRGGNTSPTSPLSNSKFRTKNFSFPLDVEGPVGTGNQGHYIMFFVNQQEDAKLGFGNAAETDAKGNANVRTEAKARKIPAYLNELTSGGTYAPKQNKSSSNSQIQQGYFADDAAASTIKQPKGKGSTITIKRRPTVRMDTAITLYMPATVATTYAVDYQSQEVGDFTQFAVDTYQNLMGDKNQTSNSIKNSLTKLGANVGDGLINKGLGVLSVIPGIEGAKDVFQAQRGFIKAPKMELFFRGIGPRTFQYQFKMIPKSYEEMQEVRKIVASFKLNMLPEFADGDRSSRRLLVPNTFDIQYMYAGVENEYLHKISTCVLENMSVSYSGEGKYATFDGVDGEGAPPTTTDITLNFKEMEIITKERVAEGF